MKLPLSIFASASARALPICLSPTMSAADSSPICLLEGSNVAVLRPTTPAPDPDPDA